ncbi:hypothetical protein H2199_006787 [Coniosporium tulheliwenetii]|uniref:Uncharacterized protein n=1 Tax=Coniosporium tulheliwenetii TaxID=3383036 RepID=A0ACC2YUG0_9PEZI|nr:hypothetical protein H2199_006787 [Cladosporium sp. JES 115]
MAAPMRHASAEASSPTAKASTAPSSCGCDPPADAYGTVKNPSEGPSQADIDACAELPVLDVNGKSHPFKTLYTGSDKASQQLLIFVRHFFCGNCQEYIRAISHAITPEALSQLSPPQQSP